MKDSIFPHPIICSAIIPDHLSFPIFCPHFKVASIHVLANFCFGAESMLHITPELSFINEFSISWDVLSFPITLLIFKRAFIITSIGFHKFPLSMWFILLPISFIVRSVFECLFSSSMPHSIFLLTYIYDSIFELESSDIMIYLWLCFRSW